MLRYALLGTDEESQPEDAGALEGPTVGKWGASSEQHWMRLDKAGVGLECDRLHTFYVIFT